MEILILIGIFAFVIAIFFRSNEALDRVGEVEKEVKTIEEEIGRGEIPAEPSPAIAENVTPPVTDSEITHKTEAGNPINTPFPDTGSVHMNS